MCSSFWIILSLHKLFLSQLSSKAANSPFRYSKRKGDHQGDSCMKGSCWLHCHNYMGTPLMFLLLLKKKGGYIVKKIIAFSHSDCRNPEKGIGTKRVFMS